MLPERLRAIRKSCGIRQEEVANFLGVKRQTYSAYERSVSVPDALTLKKLADYFGVSVEEFFMDPSDETEQTQDQYLLMLSRKTRKIPEKHRRQIIENFAKNIDLYLEITGTTNNEK